MKKLLLTPLVLATLANSSYAEMFTKDKNQITYSLTADKALDFQLVFTSPPLQDCRVTATLKDSNNKILFMDTHKWVKESDTYHVPVQAGNYSLQLASGGNLICNNKEFNLALTKVSGNFEQEFNEDMAHATPMSELNYFYGYIQQRSGHGSDQDFFKFTTADDGIVKLVFKNQNLSDKSIFYHVIVTNAQNKEVVRFKAYMDREENTQNIGLAKGDYFIRVSTSVATNKYYNQEYKMAYVLTKTPYSEHEDNDKAANATPIVDGKYIMAHFNVKEYLDNDYFIYKAVAGKYTLILQHDALYENISNITINVYDARMQKIKTLTHYGNKVKRDDFALDLPAGEVYIEIKYPGRTAGEEYQFGLVKE